MSFEVDDPCPVYEVHWRIARKPHRCECCDTAIPPGAQYRRDHMVSDGSASDEACCFACAVALHLLMARHGSHPSPSWAVDFLRECLHDSYLSPDAKRVEGVERDMLAGMLRRHRATATWKEHIARANARAAIAAAEGAP